jgi:hypothetical protein
LESFWKHPLDLNLSSTISWIGCIITGNVNASAMHRPTCQGIFRTVRIQKSLFQQVKFHVTTNYSNLTTLEIHTSIILFN